MKNFRVIKYRSRAICKTTKGKRKAENGKRKMVFAGTRKMGAETSTSPRFDFFATGKNS